MTDIPTSVHELDVGDLAPEKDTTLCMPSGPFVAHVRIKTGLRSQHGDDRNTSILIDGNARFVVDLQKTSASSSIA